MSKRDVKIIKFFILFFIFLFTLFIVNCGEAKDTRFIPEYTGMSFENNNINNNENKTESNDSEGVKKLNYRLSDNNKDKDDTITGDIVGDNKNYDKENPFDESIEDNLDGLFNIDQLEEEIYYSYVNEDVFLNVHINNPDNFEILSFVLNGQKYSSYMFENNSTMELLIIKINNGNESGLKVYTIDEIKYVDGTTIKDVKINASKSIKLGIRTDNQVAVNITNLTVDIDKLDFDVDINDKDSLIEFSKGKVSVVLYDGDEIVDIKELKIGKNKISFKKLKVNKIYQYAVIGVYDDFSTGGVSEHILYKEAFKTEPLLLFDNVNVNNDGISFDYSWSSYIKEEKVDSIKIYDENNNLVKELNETKNQIDGLLSNKKYLMSVEFTFNGNKEVIKLEFKTIEKEVPSLEISNIQSDKKAINFVLEEIDTDNIGEIVKIELYHGEELVKTAENNDVRSFEELLSNNEYTVKVLYEYDLNDGTGKKYIEKSKTIKTKELVTPVFVIVNPTKTYNSITFDVNETDSDNIGEIVKIELYHGEELVKTAENNDIRSFEELLSNNEYTV